MSATNVQPEQSAGAAAVATDTGNVAATDSGPVTDTNPATDAGTAGGTDGSTAARPAGATAEPESLWHNGDFLKFWLGETVSLYGTQVTNLALPLIAVLVFNASPVQVGLLRFLQLVPYLGLALVFGAWVDRRRRRPVLIGANVARMILIALIPVLHQLHALTMPTLLTLACVIGIASVLFDVSWMSFVPTVVKDSRHYLEANQKLGVTSSSADVAGPGILISALSAPTALIADAFSYLASLASLILVRTPEPNPATAQTRQRIPAEIRDGLRFVFGHPILRPLALVGPSVTFPSSPSGPYSCCTRRGPSTSARC